MKSIRQLNTFTNMEVISLATFLLPHVELLAFGGDAAYRKIEVRIHEETDELLCRITYRGIFKEETNVVTVFSVHNSVDDVNVDEYVGGFTDPEILKEYGITGQGCDIFIGTKKLYTYLNDTLKCWNPEQATNRINPALTDSWQEIEEYNPVPILNVLNLENKVDY